MILYLVFLEIKHEAYTLQGCYSTREKAEERVEEVWRSNDINIDDKRVVIEEWELDDEVQK